MEQEKKEDLRVVRTRKLLSQALFSLIERQSFNSISVKEICEEAMIHRATFYTHFSDKYDLMAYSLKQIAEEIHSEKSSPEEVHITIFNIAAKYKRLFSQLLVEEKDTLRYVLSKEMSSIGEGSVQKDSKSTEIVIAAFTGAALGILNWWIDHDMAVSAEDMFNESKKVLNFEYFEQIIEGFNQK
ncbi:TetR/AcrR family transcriptional regulator [Paenibacillus vandeheii]